MVYTLKGAPERWAPQLYRPIGNNPWNWTTDIEYGMCVLQGL